MRHLPALYCMDCRTTIVCDPSNDLYLSQQVCNCYTDVSMEHVLGMQESGMERLARKVSEAERLEQDYSVGAMLPVPEIPDLISLPAVSDAMIAECRADMAQAARNNWRTR